jgi:hypothetical protein
VSSRAARGLALDALLIAAVVGMLIFGCCAYVGWVAL